MCPVPAQELCFLAAACCSCGFLKLFFVAIGDGHGLQRAACARPRTPRSPKAACAASADSLQAEGLPPAPVCYVRLLAAARAGRMSEAKAWLAKYEAADSSPRLLLITAAGVAGDSPAAERWFSAMAESDRAATPAMADALVAAHAQAGNQDLASARLLELLDGGVRTTAQGLDSVLSGYADRGDWQGAEQWLDAYRSKGGQEAEPLSSRYLLHCYAGASPCPEERIVQVLGRMKAGGQMLDAETRLKLDAALGNERAAEIAAVAELDATGPQHLGS